MAPVISLFYNTDERRATHSFTEWGTDFKHDRFVRGQFILLGRLWWCMASIKINHTNTNIGVKSDEIHWSMCEIYIPVDNMECWRHDKKAAILADDIFKCNFMNENDNITIQISLNFFHGSIWQ